jgi:hypothetical protein
MFRLIKSHLQEIHVYLIDQFVPLYYCYKYPHNGMDYIYRVFTNNYQSQKLTRNLFLTLHGHNIHRQQRQLSKFLLRYQQLASHAYCGATEPDYKMALQQGTAFCVLRVEVSRSAIELSAASSSKPCTELTLHCNHRPGHLKTEHTESIFLLRRHLGNWPCGPAVIMRSTLLVTHKKLGQLPLRTVHVVHV